MYNLPVNVHERLFSDWVDAEGFEIDSHHTYSMWTPWVTRRTSMRCSAPRCFSQTRLASHWLPLAWPWLPRSCIAQKRHDVVFFAPVRESPVQWQFVRLRLEQFPGPFCTLWRDIYNRRKAQPRDFFRLPVNADGRLDFSRAQKQSCVKNVSCHTRIHSGKCFKNV